MGVFPDTLKEALVKPLLKKANLDLINNNFRPVSNLAYVSKLAKFAATSQLIEHIDRFNLKESNQLAYRHYTAQRQHFSRSRQTSSVHLTARK